MGRDGAEVVDHRQVPETPEKAEKNGGADWGLIQPHNGEGEAGPADFFDESCDQAECESDPKIVWSEGARYREGEDAKHGCDERWWNKQDGKPPWRNAHDHAAEEGADVGNAAGFGGESDA